MRVRLEQSSDITNNADGSLTIKNAIYRCAGLRQTFDLQNNLDPDGGMGDGGIVTFNLEAAHAAHVDPPALSAEASLRLEAHVGPGNVRELRHVMERAVLLRS